MNRRILVLFLLFLTGCGMNNSPIVTVQGESPLITRWALALEAKDLDAAKALMAGGSPEWESSAELALAAAPWTSHRVLELPANEKPYAPDGTVRVQWNLDVPANEIFKHMCSDIRENEGKIEGLARTFPCTSGGVYASGIEPLLFQPDDFPGAIYNEFGKNQVTRLLERGMPAAGTHASINAKRSAADPAPDYFVNIYVADPAGVESIFKWWQETAPKPLTDISGIGERAFGMETQEDAKTRRSIIFTRCDGVVQVEVAAAKGSSPVDFNLLKAAAEKIDQRLQPKRCGKL